MITIDKNAPLPNPGENMGRPRKYPWAEMEIGDSFLFPASVPYGTARSSASMAGRANGVTFSVRQTNEGLRCWRVK